MKKRNQLLIIAIAALFLLAGLVSCDEMTGNLEPLDLDTLNLDQMNLEEVATLIHEQVGEAKASNVHSCSVLPIGAKPCGGPWGYLVFSDESSDSTVLKILIERYDELDHQRNLELGRGSTCDYATEPQLILQNGMCHGEGRYAWNPGDILRFNGIE
jgi:hypothetical protein